jgi:predicted RNA-binding protein with PIN domain
MVMRRDHLVPASLEPIPRIPVTFLIDGYNLMHAVGLLSQSVPKGGLERARKRFLDWLATAAKERTALFRVVFDAHSAPRTSTESEHRGVKVLFSFRQTADDLIEELLESETIPSKITVVSNDMRLQAAGNRRGSGVYTCQQFVDWLITNENESPAPPSPPDKPEPSATDDEMAAWLAAFSTPKRKKR